MLTNSDSDWNIDDLTSSEIYAAIHYLDSDPRNANEQDTDVNNKDNGAVICVCYILHY